MFGVTFNKKSRFIYKALANCNGFFIRKKNWRHILEDESMNKHFFEHIEKHIKSEYDKMNHMMCKMK
jgi:hypothetical protein